MVRPIGEIDYTAAFKRRYRKLTPAVKASAEAKETLFRQDAFHPSLHTHKLHGDLAGCWAFSIGYDLRIVFRFVGTSHVVFLAVGSALGILIAGMTISSLSQSIPDSRQP
jgi:mRNA-degrading endonuclease YafQ of YafQ-DinJ toxin-antitoxin module